MLNAVDPLSQTFQALADPTRRAILTRLVDGDATVGELAAPFDMSLPAVSRHLKVLSAAGLIERQADAQWRRCRLRGERLRAAADWIEAYRRFWEGSFDRLASLVETMAKDDKRKEKAHGRRRRRRS
jgi:DNA-binding transcriptional ArsR family regulator